MCVCVCVCVLYVCMFVHARGVCVLYQSCVDIQNYFRREISQFCICVITEMCKLLYMCNY